jgi:hypothetical protein
MQLNKSACRFDLAWFHCELPISNYTLPIAYCQLSIANCLLFITQAAEFFE